MITVLRAGPLTTVQDLGRPGFAHLGVPRSGALDQPALRQANALAGNEPAAAVLETTLMGCRLRFDGAARIAVTGATCTLRVDGVPVDDRGPLDIPAGSVVEVGRAVAGVRSYLAVAGGIAVDPVLGSRSTDTLSGLGPAPLTDGQTLPIGARPAVLAAESANVPDGPVVVSRGAGAGSRRAGPLLAEPRRAERAEVEVGVWLGPRADWVDAVGLFSGAYHMSPMSNRIACRLTGPELSRTRTGELPPEGLVLGAIQVPPDGRPLIFLADHPTTGGYPVAGVVDDVTPLAQARPGTTVRFRELD